MSETEDIALCLTCRQVVTEIPEEEEEELNPERKDLEPYDAMQCELCDHWFHSSCLGWSMTKFRNVSAVADVMKWFCSSCDVGFKKMKEQVTVLERRVSELEAGMERRINDKISDIVLERMEREKRKNNLIIFGVPEAGVQVKGNDRVTFDSKQIRALGTVHKDLSIAPKDIELMYRVGKPKKDINRPLCIKFAENKVKARVLRSGKNLQWDEARKTIFVSPDLTQTQREENKKLYDELKKRRKDTKEDLMIKHGKIVKRPVNPQSDEATQRGGQNESRGAENLNSHDGQRTQQGNDKPEREVRSRTGRKKKGN